MKKIALFIALTTLLLVTGCRTAGSLETTNLDPERPTLRFVWASGTGRLFKSQDDFLEAKNEAHKKRTPDGWTFSSTETREKTAERSSAALILALENADTTYTELFSAPIVLGQKFSSADGTLKGTTWLETDFSTGDTIQNAFTAFEIQLPGYARTIKVEKFQLKSDNWSSIGLGSTNGVKLILIKLYKPQSDSPSQ